MNAGGANVDFVDGDEDAHARRLRRLYRALRKLGNELDDLTAVVVANTYFEFYVRHLLRKKVDLARLENENDPLNITVLIRMARSLDLMPTEVARPLVGLVRLRNKFAHNVDYELVKGDIVALGKRMNDRQREDWNFIYGDLADEDETRNKLAHQLRAYILVVRIELEELYDPLIL